mgnify:CR=1 FL=1
MTQNDFLRFAFEEAVNDLNPNSLQADVAKETLKVGMKAYAEREGCKFTDEEIENIVQEHFREFNALEQEMCPE